jgi:hypothetical protein
MEGQCFICPKSDELVEENKGTHSLANLHFVGRMVLSSPFVKKDKCHRGRNKKKLHCVTCKTFIVLD